MSQDTLLLPATKRTPSQIQLFLKKHLEQSITSSINSNSIEEMKCLLSPDIGDIILKPPQPRYTEEPGDSLEILTRTMEDIEEFKSEVAGFFNAPIISAPIANSQTKTSPTNNTTGTVSSLSKATENSKPSNATAMSSTSKTTPLRGSNDGKLGQHLRPRGGIGRGGILGQGGRLHHVCGGRGEQSRGWRSFHSGTNDGGSNKTAADTLDAEKTSHTMEAEEITAAETPASGSKSSTEQTATNQLKTLGQGNTGVPVDNASTMATQQDENRNQTNNAILRIDN
ncbi:MAG: hypothetical protein ACREOZ_04775, partial [Gloeomargaritales cyanobacterium]